jgi:hypothetical protein
MVDHLVSLTGDGPVFLGVLFDVLPNYGEGPGNFDLGELAAKSRQYRDIGAVFHVERDGGRGKAGWPGGNIPVAEEFALEKCLGVSWGIQALKDHVRAAGWGWL